MRTLAPRKGENLRDAELRWQAEADPRIRDAVMHGATRRQIAEREGISTTAVLSALRRQAIRDGAKKPATNIIKKLPEPVDWDETIAWLCDERAKLDDVIEAIQNCLPFLRREKA